MGCDIHSYAERKTDDCFEVIEGLNPFDWRQYGFLAAYREFFGPRFFEDLEELKRAGATRVIFWFDN